MILSEWSEGAMVSFLFALSLLLEHGALNDPAGHRKSAETAPKLPDSKIYNPGQVREVPVEDIAVDAVVIVRPGEKSPWMVSLQVAAQPSIKHRLPVNPCGTEECQ